MGDWGIKISKTGKSITSTTPEDYIFNSLQGTVIIYKSEEKSVTLSGSATTTSTVNYYYPDETTPLTFSYYPVVLIYVKLNASEDKWFMCPFTFNSGDNTDVYISGGSVGYSSFSLEFTNNTGSSKTIKYYYYLFANLG